MCDGEPPCGGEAGVNLLQSVDGVRWGTVPGYEVAHGEDPSVVRRGGTLAVYDDLAPGGAGLTASARLYRAGPSALRLTGTRAVSVALDAPAEARTASAVTGSFVRDADGAPTLVYALAYPPGARGCAPGRACLKIRTATEVAGSGGTRFADDRGTRFTLAYDGSLPAGSPSAVQTRDGSTILFSGPGACLHVLLADDLHGSYRPPRGLPGGCLATQPALTTPSALYRPAFRETMVYGTDAGSVSRAITRRVGAKLGPFRFRPLVALGTTLQSARVAPNTP